MMNYIDSKELQEMKEQLAILTQKLEKETIVNERLIRLSMKNKASSIRRIAIVQTIITLIMVPYFIWVVPEILKISTNLCYFTCFVIGMRLLHPHPIPSEEVHTRQSA